MTARAQRSILAVAALLVASLAASTLALPVSLDQVEVPEPANLHRFVRDREAGVRLGKALFWDMQLGSDGLTACATCHFHAGADGRTRNTLHPGGPGGFEAGVRPNLDLAREDFPSTRLADRDDRNPSTRDRKFRIVGSQGVPRADFQQGAPGAASDRGRLVRDGLFGHAARNTRQVTGRNAPSVINAVFNFANFWDGRASHYFNGVNPFGFMDAGALVLVDRGAGLVPQSLVGDLDANPYALDRASLASQAVGPPLSDVEMSWAGRSWPDIGRRLLPARPLARQRVHPADSRLAPLVHHTGLGLDATYADLVRATFVEEFWASAETAGGYSQMEANFSLFFGLAVQLYEATLVSDDTPFDRFLRGDAGAMTDRQLRGLNLFVSVGTSCTACHVGPELTGASITQTLAPGEAGLIEVMPMAQGRLAMYDIGFYNIGVRPTGEDKGRGARVTLGGQSLPLSFTGQHLERLALPFEPIAQPGCANDFLGDPPTVCPPPGQIDLVQDRAVDGAFKTPGLRNVELTGPYMHDGGMVTLMQVVDFYVRGADFHDENLEHLDPVVDGVVPMRGIDGEELKRELVDFLLSLTDERVRWERAPFDHPQLFVPDGHEPRVEGNPKRARVLADRLREIPAVGVLGRQPEALPPLKPFLADGLEGAALAEFHFQP